ncbi:hypothetical protein GGX14DRAFT_485752 [Mycena pura]|uniref:Uncharacterized protein n=1 Tax=Mycena pura TaxID=153505 RepID=A0AAD6Y2K1_9AGAR|nr:hypothetical protein GGX14DRAFT_485752 [Mycena pura]
MAAWVTLSVMIMNGTTGMPGGTFFPGCLFSAPVYFYAAWIPAVIFESVIIFITLYYAFAYYNAKMQNPTLYILARDSILYFFAILPPSNLFIARFGKDFLGSLLIAPSSVIACIGAARMMMNIREVTSQDVSDSQDLRICTV